MFLISHHKKWWTKDVTNFKTKRRLSPEKYTGGLEGTIHYQDENALSGYDVAG